MVMRWKLIALVVVAVALVSSARGEPAEQAFARGKESLAKGDFEAALAAYATAVRGDLDNEGYREQYALVRRTIDLRKRLDVEQDPERWEYIARALHAFYLGQGLHGEAVGLARKLHAKQPSASTAVLLAETELAMNNDAAAAKALGALDKSAATSTTESLLGVALVRQGKKDEARAIAKNITIPQDAGPQATYSYARLQAVLGNADAAEAALTRTFESLPPSRLKEFKEHAKVCPDFTAMAATAGFAKALATESKVPESACSGGSGCAGCPMRGNCSKAGASQP